MSVLDTVTTKQLARGDWWLRAQVERAWGRENRPPGKESTANTGGGKKPADDREWTAEQMAEARSAIQRWREHPEIHPEPTKDQRAAAAAYDRKRYADRRKS